MWVAPREGLRPLKALPPLELGAVLSQRSVAQQTRARALGSSTPMRVEMGVLHSMVVRAREEIRAALAMGISVRHIPYAHQ